MSKFVMIIFGASGDLTKRKLMPALYTLYNDGRLPDGFPIVGIGRTDYTDSHYQEYIRKPCVALSMTLMVYYRC